jgi:hypothetical protein
MPAGDVVISGTFSQTPVKSNELAILDVSVSSNIPPLLSKQYDYTAKIPHIFPTIPEQKFSIIAIPEDPEAEVSISLPDGGKLPDAGEEIKLNEGKSEYTITVTRDGLTPDTNTYTLTVDYEPDLTLKSIELSSSENSDWTQTVAVQDGQTLTVPYNSVTITASPNGETVTLAASKSSGSGGFTTGGADNWTLTYSDIQDAYAVYSTVTIKSTKNIVNGGDYEKDFTLKFEKIVDANWPTSYWAASTDGNNGVSIIKEEDGEYYEIHTFMVSDTLSVTGIPEEGLTAWVLVVAGGGSGGDCVDSYNKDLGGGGGGGGVGYSESVSLAVQDYTVVVGGGGNGSKGGNSGFGDITVEGGGKGGIGTSADAGEAQKGGSGGSGGGGAAGGGSTRGTGGSANTHAAVTEYQFFGSNGDNGNGNDAGPTTAGGNGGSANFSNNISGTSKEYGKGGIAGGLSGDTPAVNGTGNGGNGAAKNGSGNNGSSGVVIVRFPARPNDTTVE